MKKHLLFMLMCAMGALATGQAATEKIRIMTFNVPQGNIKESDGNGHNTWDNRALAIQQYMAEVKPDLLGMQEPTRTVLCSILQGMPRYAMVGTARDDGAERGEYTAIIYRTDRFYCIDAGNYWLTETPDVHSKVEGSTHFRIATWALFQDKQSGARFLYTNTHLSYDSQPVRLAQLKIIKPYMLGLNQKYGEKLPHFFTGDFNMRDTEDNYNYVLNYKLLMKDMWGTARTHRHWNYGSGANEGRIDYIFATRGVSCSYAQWDNRKREDGYWMSDHDPLWADVSFTTSVEDNARGAIAEAWCLLDSLYTYTKKHIKLVTSSTQLSSDGVETSTPLANALDGRNDTYVHSLYNTTPPPQPHYLQVKLRREVTNFRFNYTRRNHDEYGPADRWQDVMITASSDGQQWDYITQLHDFADLPLHAYTSENIALHRPYTYVRFSVMHTPAEKLRNGNPQFSLSEFQMYENVPEESSERYATERISEAANRLEALIGETQEALERGTITAAQVTALRQATKALSQARREALTPICQPLSPACRPKAVYDLSGRRVSRMQRGIYIRNGKKVLR
ncbi:MAG: endonuclease/exonuclease/phosphatase family protein [Bacteroidaceae bacterium]|nr:endonuclease/exonuclease/phosphatase family protein [Bacteroidaceae bacterium]